MAAGVFADVPDLTLTCDGVRLAGGHAVNPWIFTGTDPDTGRSSRIEGCEAWDRGDDGLGVASRDWFDGDECMRRAEGG